MLKQGASDLFCAWQRVSEKSWIQDADRT
jgi:hypothetical protein